LAIVVANPVDWELEDGESEAVGVIIVVVAGKKKWRQRKAIVGNIILKYE
jgi:hypothetical protein